MGKCGLKESRQLEGAGWRKFTHHLQLSEALHIFLRHPDLSGQFLALLPPLP